MTHIEQKAELTQEDGTIKRVLVGEKISWKNPNSELVSSRIMLQIFQNDYGQGPFTLLGISYHKGATYLHFLDEHREEQNVASVFFSKFEE
ncbi:MAG: hypothetical protein UV60_C0006G0096 [Parcubacteria group bacterium GW2011_GWA2_43_11]|nr:MAG: hypothetical protein UV60_C0006G0096 [Parcubacteria group bacterium GW2011_GWA2_43_11]